MRTVLLSGKKAAGRVASVDDDDHARLMVAGFTWYAWERSAGLRYHSGPYAITVTYPDGDKSGRKRVIQMHNWLTGWPKVDHQDGDGLNNQRRTNLRKATDGQNAANRPALAGCSSQFKGVRWHAGKWEAGIKVDGRARYLGRFADEIRAALAYDTAAREEFGEFAWLNFP
jgi:hypothetical protein